MNISEINNISQIVQVPKEQVKSQESKISQEQQVEDNTRLDKYKLISKINTNDSVKDPQNTLNEIKEVINKENLQELMDKDYIESNQKNIFFNLVEEKDKDTYVNKDITLQEFEKNLRSTLDSIKSEKGQSAIETKLKEVLSSINSTSESGQIDSFKTILLQGLLINLKKDDSL